MSTRNLRGLFDPRSIAVVGASERAGSVGCVLLQNLLDARYEGNIYPVNVSAESVQGLPAWPSVAQLPEQVDLAVLAVPAWAVPAAMHECGEAGVLAALIVSAGFRETGEEGRFLEDEVRTLARRYGVRILGPNCLGFVRPAHHLNVTFASTAPPDGHIAFFSQSGALGAAILDWATAHQVGFSVFVSVGSMADVDFGDLIDHFGADAHTSSIILYIESVGDARKFMSAAKHFATSKPIIAVKSGRTVRGAEAAASHTGAIAGDDALYSAMFRRAGVVRVNEIEDLFDASEALSLASRPRGPRLGIVTNAGGPGVMACDRLLELGGELADLSARTEARLRATLPEFSSRGNPVDVLGDASAARYADAARALMDDPNCDGVLAILTPQAMSNPTGTAQALAEASKAHPHKPLLASFMGETAVADGLAVLERAHVPTFGTPEQAVRACMYMCEYARNLANIYETPVDILPDFEPDRDAVAALFATVAQSGRSILSEPEAKSALAAYDIPVNTTTVATSPGECAAAAERIGFPVAVKILSHDITYKSDIGGVALDVRSAIEAAAQFTAITERAVEAAPTASIVGVTVQPMVRGGCETIIGARHDATFGPAILFGMGGTNVELHRDVTLDFPPLNEALARTMIERTRVSRLLKGYRSAAPADMVALERALVKASYLLVDFPEILEMDVNPLVVRTDGVCALNARIALQPAEAGGAKPPGSHLMIPVYPTRYQRELDLGGEKVQIRAIKPEDEPLWKEMVASFSEATADHRFFGHVGAVTKAMLVRYCHIDYDREVALVAIRTDEGDDAKETMLGVAQLTLETASALTGEFAIVVRDACQGKGLGHTLMATLIDAARERHMNEITGDVLTANRGMLRFAESLGFDVLPGDESRVRRVVLRL